MGVSPKVKCKGLNSALARGSYMYQLDLPLTPAQHPPPAALSVYTLLIPAPYLFRPSDRPSTWSKDPARIRLAPGAQGVSPVAEAH
jgi:hypothetical protein